MCIGQLSHAAHAPAEFGTRGAHAGVHAGVAHRLAGQGIQHQARPCGRVLRKLRQHGAHLIGLQVHEHALAHHQHRLRARALPKAEPLPPARLGQVHLRMALARAARGEQRFAQRHHGRQVSIQPVVGPRVQPLKVVREAAAQVHPPALRVLRKEGSPRLLDGPRAPKHVEHGGQIVERGAGIHLQPLQQLRRHGIATIQPREITPPMRPRRQWNQQGAGHGRQLRTGLRAIGRSARGGGLHSASAAGLLHGVFSCAGRALHSWGHGVAATTSARAIVDLPRPRASHSRRRCRVSSQYWSSRTTVCWKENQLQRATQRSRASPPRLLPR